MTVYTLGPEGTFSHEAAKALFPEHEIAFEDRLEDVFQHDLIVVPLKNTYSGEIATTKKYLKPYQDEKVTPLFYYQEFNRISLPIIHHLAGYGTLETIKAIYGHPHTLRQCEKKIQENLPHATLIQTSSNALSAQKLKKEDQTHAAIIPEHLSQDFPILIKELTTNENQTIFVALEKKASHSLKLKNK